MSVWSDWVSRLGHRWGWVAGQFGGVLLLLLMGMAWTRLPDKHGWQVVLTLAVPVLLLAVLLALQAGTMRALTDDDGRRVRLAWGAMALLAWIAVFWAAWTVLDWCDGRIPLWAGYLNSQAPAHWRARALTYEHLLHWMTRAEWVLRWIVVPGKLTMCAVASAQWGWRLPWRRLMRVLLNWRWWPAVVAAALLAVRLPSWFFTGIPRGTVGHQVWTVVLKLGGTYMLAVGCWVLLLGWAAALLARTAQADSSPAEAGGNSGGKA
ncbi:MAG: hypothetical protein WA532_13295 [Candidatus Korobacteraceae bacterium]